MCKRARDPQEFETWQRLVNRELVQLCGLDLEGIPDVPAWEWFERRIPPFTAARMAVKAAMRY